MNLLGLLTRSKEQVFPAADRDAFAKEKGGTPEGARQGNDMLMHNNALPTRVYMSPEEWASIPANPRQRDTERHAQRADHLRKPHPIHAIVNMATLPDGRHFKLDGHTRSFLWEKGDVPPPATLIVDRWVCQTLTEVKELYQCFDGKGAVETTADRMFGAFRENSVAFKSPLLSSRHIATALRFGYAFLYGQKASLGASEYDLLKYWMVELRLLDECMPTSSRFPSGVTWASLVVFRRYGDQATDFFTRYAAGLGNKSGAQMDGVQALTDRVHGMRGKRKLTSSANILEIGSLTFSAFLAYRAGRHVSFIRPLGKDTLAEWSLAAKRANRLEV